LFESRLRAVTALFYTGTLTYFVSPIHWMNEMKPSQLRHSLINDVLSSTSYMSPGHILLIWAEPTTLNPIYRYLTSDSEILETVHNFLPDSL
jgi:hypothetical protein